MEDERRAVRHADWLKALDTSRQQNTSRYCGETGGVGSSIIVRGSGGSASSAIGHPQLGRNRASDPVWPEGGGSPSQMLTLRKRHRNTAMLNGENRAA